MKFMPIQRERERERERKTATERDREKSTTTHQREADHTHISFFFLFWGGGGGGKQNMAVMFRGTARWVHRTRSKINTCRFGHGPRQGLLGVFLLQHDRTHDTWGVPIFFLFFLFLFYFSERRFLRPLRGVASLFPW